jgi:hypothetical protein
MGLQSPIGLVIIRDKQRQVAKIAAFQFYQNAVDYLSTHAQARDWRKVGSDSYVTPTDHIVSVTMLIPDGINLTREHYLEVEQHDQKDQETAASKGR